MTEDNGLSCDWQEKNEMTSKKANCFMGMTGNVCRTNENAAKINDITEIEKGK